MSVHHDKNSEKNEKSSENMKEMSSKKDKSDLRAVGRISSKQSSHRVSNSK